MNLVMMKGLPGSGKSTYAKKLVDEGYVRVNKDDIRAMLNNGKWSKANEKFVLKLRDYIVRAALSDGKSVVVDDTNFEPKHAESLLETALNHKASFKVEFIDTPLEECIERDLKRPNSVGEKVIRRMYNKYLRKIDTPKQPSTDIGAIIVDIDGTLAHMKDRSPYDWNRVGEDDFDNLIATIAVSMGAMAKMAGSDVEIILLSGRDGSCREETEKWLAKHEMPYNHLFMREAGDMRKDSIVKSELYEELINGTYEVLFVLDDRDQVVEMWRNKGLTCLQVAEGDF